MERKQKEIGDKYGHEMSCKRKVGKERERHRKHET